MIFRIRLALACLLALAGLSALAQGYPAKPIHLIVPWPPTGTVDILGRTLGQKLSENMAQSFIIDNRAGANGIIGSDVGAKSPPDGYTLVVDNITGHAINATLQARMPFDSLRDFAHVSLLAWVPDGIVGLPSLPARNVQELIALAKAQPGKLTYASFGVGSSGHLAGELFKMMAGVDMLHVPYKGGGPAIADLLAGQVSIYYPVLPSVVSLVKADRLRLLAVTGAQRSSAMPEVPTVAESGLPGFEASNWFGLMAPAGTPPEIVARLNSETARAMQAPDLRAKLAALGMEIQTSTPQEFSALLRNETEKWAKVVKTSGARAE
ncbi:MAG TPA: tripartite tricarboxylate transporter substrate binding protein [Burkholderiales bacterium]|nr:tripartite tricarboxylate transporter substrate binding protein [Burkholderiales bacterium]